MDTGTLKTAHDLFRENERVFNWLTKVENADNFSADVLIDTIKTFDKKKGEEMEKQLKETVITFLRKKLTEIDNEIKAL